MNTARLNITMPEDVREILKEAESKSAYIADAVRTKKRLEEKARPRKLLEAAYKEAAKDDYETCKEWEPTLRDGLGE
jgi:hypothetical protein